MVLLLEIIAQSTLVGDKVLVFSQRTLALDFVERILMTKGWGGCVKTPPPASMNGKTSWGPWYSGVQYFRLDGTTESSKR